MENCLQLLLKTMVNSYRDILVGLKLKTLQIHDAVSLLIPTTKIFSEGNYLGGIFVLSYIIFLNEIACKTRTGRGSNSKRVIKLSLHVLFMMKKKTFVKEVWKDGEKQNCFSLEILIW